MGDQHMGNDPPINPRVLDWYGVTISNGYRGNGRVLRLERRSAA
jgi:hypothetical protein